MSLRRVLWTVGREMIGVFLIGLGVLLSSRPAAVAGMTPNMIDPPGGGVVEILVRMLIFGAGPLLGVALHRHWGGRGILGGLLAGGLIYGGYSLYLNSFGRPDPFSFGVQGDLLLFSFAGAWNGLILGVVAWVSLGINDWAFSQRAKSISEQDVPGD